MFNLPSIEYVIQDYHAGFWRGLPYGWWQGRMIITTNHVLFRSTVGNWMLCLLPHFSPICGGSFFLFLFFFRTRGF
jgi:hypothetical protein